MKQMILVGSFALLVLFSGCGSSGPQPEGDIPTDTNETNIIVVPPCSMISAVEKIIADLNASKFRVDAQAMEIERLSTQLAAGTKEISALKTLAGNLRKENSELKTAFQELSNKTVAASAIPSVVTESMESTDGMTLTFEPCEVGQKCYVATFFANVRSTPNDEARIVRVHEKHDLVEVLDQKDHFFKTKDGWIRDYILKKVQYSSQIQGEKQNESRKN